MRSNMLQAAAAGGAGHAGGVIHVREADGAPAASAAAPAEQAQLTQAERAARALQRDRGPKKEMSIELAFLEAALDSRRTLRTLVAAVVPGFADWCFVDLVDAGGVPRRAEVAHADPAQAPLALEMLSIGFGPGWATPAAQAIRDRAPRMYPEITNDIMRWATHDQRHLAVLRAMKPNSLLAVPLVARDHAIGALTLIRSAMLPPLDEAALVVAAELAVPAALALDNARRYEAERTDRIAAQEALRTRPRGR